MTTAEQLLELEYLRREDARRESHAVAEFRQTVLRQQELMFAACIFQSLVLVGLLVAYIVKG